MYHLYRRISNCLLCVRGAVSLRKKDKEEEAYGSEHMGQRAHVLRLRYARDFFNLFKETQASVVGAALGYITTALA